MKMPPENKEGSRDDAVAQPESGYPEGRVPTKPSAEPEPGDAAEAAEKGSESEFDSPKLLSEAARHP
jgi:hypothetical protein